MIFCFIRVNATDFTFVYYFVSMKSDKRVLLGMSGGTDSSVAAMRLQEAGYEVTGVTFRFYEAGDETGYLKMHGLWP